MLPNERANASLFERQFNYETARRRRDGPAATTQRYGSGIYLAAENFEDRSSRRNNDDHYDVTEELLASRGLYHDSIVSLSELAAYRRVPRKSRSATLK